MSSRLNYFFPYSDPHAENNLTRAFLVVLRYSPLAQTLFYELIREQVAGAGLPDPAHRLPTSAELPWTNIQLHTQAGNLRGWSSGQLVSILISNAVRSLPDPIVPADRKGVYDGLVLLDEQVMLMLENKPHDNYWPGQLNPARTDLGPETVVIPHGVALCWRDVIRCLQQVSARAGVTDQERFLIQDFFEYVNQAFPQLNPYDKLGLCRHEEPLLNRRLERVLAEVGGDVAPAYHQGWCHYLPLAKRSAQMVGLKLEYKAQRPEEWKLELLWYPGTLMSQARALHANPGLAAGLAALQTQPDGARWAISSNFHLHKFPVGGLFWAYGLDDPLNHYLDFWRGVVQRGELYQRSKKDTVKWLQALAAQGELQFSAATLQKEVIDPGYQTYNSCPGLEMVYTLTSQEAIELDARNELVSLIRDKITQVDAILT